MIPRLLRRGVRFTIATGRALRGVSDVLARLSLPATTPIALYNGSLGVDAGLTRVVWAQTIRADAARRVVRWALTAQVPVLCYPSPATVGGHLGEAPLGFTWNGLPAPHPEPNGYSVKWEGPDSVQLAPQCLALLIDLRGAERPILPRGLESLDEFTVTMSGPSFLEVRPYRADKGHAPPQRSLADLGYHWTPCWHSATMIMMSRCCASRA
jgi:hydroxymethylpyrimidine pyrophosphatase-like HAD family hydrolase